MAGRGGTFSLAAFLIALLLPPSGALAQPAAAPSERATEDAVKRTLAASMGRAAVQVEVRVRAGIATLSGTLPERSVLWLARDTAAVVEGVARVADNLALEPEAGDDRELAQRVSEAIEADPATNGQGLRVRSQRHVIILEGQVNNDAVALRARALARAVRGVLDLGGRLEPRLAYTRPRTASQIRADVAGRTAGLAPHGRVEARVDRGKVILVGQVPRAEDRRAIVAAAWVPDVTAVDASLLRVRWWSGARVATAEPPPAPADPALEDELVGVFRDDPRFAPFSPKIWVRDGVATLVGRVPTPGVREAARAVATLLPGITEVRLGLRLDPTLTEDDRLTSLVTARLVRDPFVPGRDLRVVVRGGRVSLTGWVRTNDIAQRAQFLAAGVPGVKAVANGLRVAPPAPPRVGLARPERGLMFSLRGGSA